MCVAKRFMLSAVQPTRSCTWKSCLPRRRARASPCRSLNSAMAPSESAILRLKALIWLAAFSPLCSANSTFYVALLLNGGSKYTRSTDSSAT